MSEVKVLWEAKAVHDYLKFRLVLVLMKKELEWQQLNLATNQWSRFKPTFQIEDAIYLPDFLQNCLLKLRHALQENLITEVEFRHLFRTINQEVDPEVKKMKTKTKTSNLEQKNHLLEQRVNVLQEMLQMKA